MGVLTWEQRVLRLATAPEGRRPQAISGGGLAPSGRIPMYVFTMTESICCQK